MSASLTGTSTLSYPALAANYGKLSTAPLEVMDVGSDGQQPLGSQGPNAYSGDRAMIDATPLPTPHATSTNEIKIPGLSINNVDQVTNPDLAPAHEQPQPELKSAQESQKQTAPVLQNPLLTHNVLSMYGLDPLVATVARTHPVTGEKINKMRKSYEGQLKSLGLAGRNKAVKHDDSKGESFMQLARWPEEEFHNQRVHGKDVRNGLPVELKAMLGKAMELQPGKIPDNDYWEDLLGIEKVKPFDPAAKPVKSALATKVNGQSNGQINGNTQTGSTAVNSSQPNEPIRARRTGKRKSYGDSSYEGYGDGYVDDDMEQNGYSSGESRSTRTSQGGRKRRKTKDYNSNSSFGGGSNSFTAATPISGVYSRG